MVELASGRLAMLLLVMVMALADATRTVLEQS